MDHEPETLKKEERDGIASARRKARAKIFPVRCAVERMDTGRRR